MLGADHAARIDRLVASCVDASWAAAQGDASPDLRIELGSEVLAATDALRGFLFDRVYLAETTLQAARRGQAVIEALFTHYEARPGEIEGFSLPGDPPWRRAADYVAGMTDGFALRRAAALGLAGRVAQRADPGPAASL